MFQAYIINNATFGVNNEGSKKKTFFQEKKGKHLSP